MNRASKRMQQYRYGLYWYTRTTPNGNGVYAGPQK